MEIFGISTGRKGKTTMPNYFSPYATVNLPIDPPWVDFIHYTGCEDSKFYQCPECKTLVPDSDLNICECNLKFIPRPTECICDDIDSMYD